MMKPKLTFSVLFLIFFLFLARGGWLPTDVRLNTGDTPGANSSSGPQISSSGNNIYVVWYDNRHDGPDIYFNYSLDRGTTWQSSDIRLNTGKPAGDSTSKHPQIESGGSNVYAVWADWRNGAPDIYFNYSSDNGASWQSSDSRLNVGAPIGLYGAGLPQISSSGSNVCIVWEDYRNGEADIYFNYSTDGGVTWQASDIRIDTGDSPGEKDSYYPQISSNGNYVYVVWEDYRNGEPDIYFNYSTDGGVTWQASDILLSTGAAPGQYSSRHPQISSSANNVYVVWEEVRTAFADIYFNYSSDCGVSWQSAGIRLNTGIPPGTNNSSLPRISSSNNNVYVVWSDCRNGEPDIYFNYSADGGVTWQTSSIRLDCGDPPGANGSFGAEISSSDSNVYAVWFDYRNGELDIFFNFSVNKGVTWPRLDIRLDTGEPPGTTRSRSPKITCSDNKIYAVWQDRRNGDRDDIYFNTAEVPKTDIKANGSDGPITISKTDTLSLTIELTAGTPSGMDSDWWLVARTPHGWYHYHPTSGWLPGREVSLQIPLRNFPIKEVLNTSNLPIGTYTFYFGIDLLMNGSIDMDKGFYDKVKVTINP
jgi:hypothetical protein